VLRELHRRWQQINDDCLEGRLQAPIFTLDEATARVGRWTATTRTLGISIEHLQSATWLELEQTLRHEMAHQVVSELFDSGGAPPHGRLFRRACRMVGLTENEEIETAPAPETKRAMRRIQKLMNLSTSPNEHEARAAMAAANRMLLEHNLEQQDSESTPPFVYRWIGDPSGRITLVRKLMARILQDHFFVQCLWVHTTQPTTGKRVRMLEIMGRRHNVTLAEFVHQYLARTLNQLWRAYRKEKAKTRVRGRGNEYRVGVLMGFDEHLDSEKQMCQSQGLIWTGDPALHEFVSQRYPRRRSIRSSYYRVGEAHHDGRVHGRDIRIPGALESNKSANGVRAFLA
jgi:predicted SprT family Zn-dependent metalloprotease